MSLLKTKAEDLLAAKTNDARAIAKSTLVNDKDDLVSDKDRERDDGGASGAIDVALRTGTVHQESLTLEGEDLSEIEDLLKEAKNEEEVQSGVIIEAKDLNSKAFLNKPEQSAFAHYMARKSVKHPMSGLPMLSDIEMMEMANMSGDFKMLSDRMSEEAVLMGMANDEYMKLLKSSMEKALKLDAKSPELLMWKTLTSRLQPVV